MEGSARVPGGRRSLSSACDDDHLDLCCCFSGDEQT